MRPTSKVIIAILNPCPGSPSKFSFGIRQLSKIKFAVELPRIPSLSSFLPRLKPGVPFSTMNALIPLCFKLLSVVAKTTAQSASCAFVIQHFSPFNIQASPSSRAVVLAAPASLPFPGSLKPKQPIFSPEANGANTSLFVRVCHASQQASNTRYFVPSLLLPPTHNHD